MAPHPIFADIDRSDLEAVKQRVLAEPALWKKRGPFSATPLIYAIHKQESAIAIWLIEHRGRNSLEQREVGERTALLFACANGTLSVVKALVAAGADVGAVGADGSTPFKAAVEKGYVNIAALLLEQPAIRNRIDRVQWRYVDGVGRTPLSLACYYGNQPMLRLLLDAGADPTCPACPYSPLNQATRYNRHAIAALIRRAIEEPNHEPDECPICLEHISLRDGVMTECKHEFHEACLDRWRQREASCPNCRGKI